MTKLSEEENFGDSNTVLIIVLAWKYFKVKDGSRCFGYFVFILSNLNTVAKW